MKITLLTGQTFNLQEKLGFEIKVVKSPLAKRLTLRIDEKAHIPVLTIPKYCSGKKALAFVEAHRDWIQNMLAKLPPIKHFSNGDQISIMGQKYIILHRPEQRGIILKDGFLTLGGNHEFLHRRVTDYLKTLAAKELGRMSLIAAKKIGCKINHVSIKDTKSRWGSCSNKSNINYNWRIIMAPYDIIEYLVCHEVSHLAHQDHSEDFWQCVAKLCPQYKECQHWLKIRGKELYRYQ